MSTSTSDRRRQIRERRRELARRQWLEGLSLLALFASLLLVFSTSVFRSRERAAPRPLAAAAPYHTSTPLALAAAPSPFTAVTSTPITIGIPTVTLSEITVGVLPLSTPSPSGLSPSATPTPIPTVTATPLPTLTPTAVPRTIALIAGHRNNDSGAICESGPYEGLWEVHVTTDVTERLARLLTAKGYNVVDLDEYDARLPGLQAAVMLSLHADSCVDWEGATGYKIARADASAIPDIEDRLVACLSEQYSRATRLPQHPGSITHNMTDYHAFRQVDPTTPAAIIELGFLYHDHEVLTQKQDVLAEALLLGIECFLKGE